MSQKYSGGFITKSPVAPTTSAASGIWTLDQQQQAQQAGNWPSPPVFIEDVYSISLWTGNGTSQTITNNINLSANGGLVWIKSRNITGGWHDFFDTVRGVGQQISSNETGAQFNSPQTVTAFNSSGFSIGSDGDVNRGNPGDIYVSWAFQEKSKFFDIVTWTGNATNRTIAHSLGSVPGSIIVKRTDTTADWAVYHRSLANTQYLVLNSTAAPATGATWWNSTTPTSAVFSVGTDASVNASGGTYVAYLFAHDAGGFGLTGTDNVISCGTWTGNTTVNLGYEPQWVLIKRTDSTSNWFLLDVMRGWTAGGVLNFLLPNSSAAESTSAISYLTVNSTGFAPGSDSYFQTGTFIYVAIRRGPMKVPTLGTSVFTPSIRAGTGATATTSNLSFPPDMVWSKGRDNGGTNSGDFDRLRGATRQLSLNQTDSEATASTSLTGFDVMTGYAAGDDAVQLTINATGYNYVNWQFRRAPSFFDEVCYTGTGVAGRTVTHNLTVTPEIIIVKKRSASEFWGFLNVATSSTGALNSTAGLSTSNNQFYFGNDTIYIAPTSSVFTVGSVDRVNILNGTYVAYLFATCAGVSKVGSYSGSTGNTVTVPCGFTAGTRFVLIKRTDSTGDWYVWDSARGIVAGNDPYLLLNSTAAEVTGTDYVDTYSAGFEVTSTAPAGLNATGGTYIFLAIA